MHDANNSGSKLPILGLSLFNHDLFTYFHNLLIYCACYVLHTHTQNQNRIDTEVTDKQNGACHLCVKDYLALYQKLRNQLTPADLMPWLM